MAISTSSVRFVSWISSTSVTPLSLLFIEPLRRTRSFPFSLSHSSSFSMSILRLAGYSWQSFSLRGERPFSGCEKLFGETTTRFSRSDDSGTKYFSSCISGDVDSQPRHQVASQYPFIQFCTVIVLPHFIWMFNIEIGLQILSTRESFSATYGQVCRQPFVLELACLIFHSF